MVLAELERSHLFPQLEKQELIEEEFVFEGKPVPVSFPEGQMGERLKKILGVLVNTSADRPVARRDIQLEVYGEDSYLSKSYHELRDLLKWLSRSLEEFGVNVNFVKKGQLGSFYYLGEKPAPRISLVISPSVIVIKEDQLPANNSVRAIEKTSKDEESTLLPDHLLYQLGSALLAEGVQRSLNPYGIVLSSVYVDKVNIILWDIKRRLGNQLFDSYLARRRDLRTILGRFAQDPDEFLKTSSAYARVVLEPFRGRPRTKELFNKLLPDNHS